MALLSTAHARIVGVLASLALTGCFSTELTPLEPPSGLEKLEAVSDTTVPIRLQTNGLQERSLGFQYLFMAIPVSRIYVPHLQSDVRQQLAVAGGLRGYRFTDASDSSNLLLEIAIEELSVNGYDLLVVRKPTSSVTMKARLSKDGQVVRECVESYRSSNSAHYAFAGELQHALSESLLHGSYKMLDCLGLKGSQ
jgi:hypothetical protein